MKWPMRALTIGALLVALTTTARAETIIAQHIGTTDPTTEYFAQDMGTAGNPINDDGTAAWEINSGKNRYIADVSSQVATLDSSTWQMSATLRDAVIPYDRSLTGIYLELSYGSGDAAKTYAITIGSRRNSPTEVEVMAGRITDIYSGNYAGIMGVGAYGEGYHTYKIAKENPASDDVHFYVDGGLQMIFGPTTGSGTISDLNRFVWGASGGTATVTADARWSAVSLSTVPEPASMTALLGGMLALCCYAWRKRK